MATRSGLARLPRALLDGAVDALLPQRCIVCGRFGAALHTCCLDGLPQAAGPRCEVCWAPSGAAARSDRCARCGEALPTFEALRTPYRFAGVARRALLEAKFRGATALLEPLGRAAAASVPRSWAVEAVTPLPLHASRRRRRGFDQAELIARTVAAELGLPLRAGLLRRVRATEPQAALGAEQRARNIADAFVAAGNPPSSVLLVDDVTTTGATLEAGASASQAAGAERAYALAVARED